MPSRIILTLSAVLLFLCGGGGLVAPDEIALSLGATSWAGVRVLTQIGAAALLGFAVSNWMSRGSRFGGVYNRPLGIGNLLLFSVAALSLGREVLAGHLPAVGAVLAVVFGSLALALAWLILLRDPLEH